MRTHSEIIEAAKVGEIIRQMATLGMVLKDPTVRSWMSPERNGIPSEYWLAFVSFGFATMDELAAASTKQKLPALAKALRRAAA